MSICKILPRQRRLCGIPCHGHDASTSIMIMRIRVGTWSPEAALCAEKVMQQGLVRLGFCQIGIFEKCHTGHWLRLEACFALIGFVSGYLLESRACAKRARHACLPSFSNSCESIDAGAGVSLPESSVHA